MYGKICRRKNIYIDNMKYFKYIEIFIEYIKLYF